MEELFIGDGVRSVSVSRAAIEEHQIDVGRIVQFAPAQFPQCKDAQAARLGISGFVDDHGRAEAPLQFAKNPLIGNAKDGIGQV